MEYYLGYIMKSNDYRVLKSNPDFWKLVQETTNCEKGGFSICLLLILQN